MVVGPAGGRSPRPVSVPMRCGHIDRRCTPRRPGTRFGPVLAVASSSRLLSSDASPTSALAASRSRRCRPRRRVVRLSGPSTGCGPLVKGPHSAGWRDALDRRAFLGRADGARQPRSQRIGSAAVALRRQSAGRSRWRRHGRAARSGRTRHVVPGHLRYRPRADPDWMLTRLGARHGEHPGQRVGLRAQHPTYVAGPRLGHHTDRHRDRPPARTCDG
jgi:hypothetical protein